MSLTSKLIVCDFFYNFYNVHHVYGEYYQLFRIADEHLTQSHVGNLSCIEREALAARRLLANEISPDDAAECIDAVKSVEKLTNWFSCGYYSDDLDSKLISILKHIDNVLPLEIRNKKGRQIFFLDQFRNEIDDKTNICEKINDLLKTKVYNFIIHMCTEKLTLVAATFRCVDDVGGGEGWWYNKFCVLTYIKRISVGIQKKKHKSLVDDRLINVVRQTIDEFGERYNCPKAVAILYGKFCGIGKNHFKVHRSASAYVLFNYLRDTAGRDDEKFECYNTIVDFGKHIKDAYVCLKNCVDALYINSDTDSRKNAVFDLMCVMNDAELDIDCFWYIMESCVLNKNLR
ncbi:unknown [Euproctis pseudoconspersa nucleopolyhedrovirus]|uniref:Ac11 n=1 Tax=Euproctis pseudoconspersa nucleopolyhedrovirus TaxID=307467 RepID=C3TX30_9ABAC|nr:hypothetical protein EupsNPV_gp122 [Euproctis pseudoconspersa nucleopolyhedrovirus]ACO53572.1 unknown [Euproctis pseudoconspersa nucleopolyhedrovirus]